MKLVEMKDEIRVGLIGYGFAGRTFHAPVIAAVPELKLAAVVQRSADTARERYPWVKIVRSVRELFDDGEIDAVVVTTPSTDHFEVTRDALLAGKHVVVEKPFTRTTAEADELIAIARDKGLVLSVFHNRRWDGDFQTVSRIVEQGLLGRLVEAEFRWDRYHPEADPSRWRDNGQLGTGTFYDLGSHFLDQALTLFGTPLAIIADIRAVRDNAVADDFFDVRLTYRNGFSVSLKSSLLAREHGPRYVLRGTAGSFVKYGEDPQEAALIPGQTPATADWGADPEHRWGALNTTVGGLQVVGRIRTMPGAYPSYFRNFAQAIRGSAELAVRPEQARMVVRLIELGLQSSKERREIEVTS